jgi:hypothetical protein
MRSWRRAQRDLYLAQRTMGDIDAAQRGKLGKRLLRRSLTRSLFRLFR